MKLTKHIKKPKVKPRPVSSVLFRPKIKPIKARKPRVPKPKAPKINVEAFDLYLNRHYQNKHTQKQYGDCVRRFKRLARLINQRSIDRYLSIFTNNTLNRAFIKALCKCFDVNKIDLPTQKSRRHKKIRKFLTYEEVQYVIRNTKPKTSLIVRLMFDTGLRLAEVINLKFKNIDLTKRYVEGIGKGNKGFREPFSPETKRYMYSYLKRHAKMHPFWYAEVRHHDKKFWRCLKLECEDSGMENVHPHKIRHAMGHYLRTVKGWDIEQIREKLRHSSISTTQIYANASKEEVDKKMETEVFN